MASASTAIDLGLLADLPEIPLRAKYLVEGFLSGQHRSPLKGYSVEFAEYRSYQTGDEPRRVDWRLYGRSDRLCVKVFEEETQLRVFLLLDGSPSMDYASQARAMTKLDYARTTLAALAFLANRQGDSFGMAHLGDGVHHFLQARSSLGHLRTVFGKLGAASPGHVTQLASSIHQLAELLPSRSIVVIASDFYEEIPALENALGRLRYDGHDLIALQILDPIEADFEGIHGILVDTETRQQIRASSAEMRESYLARFQAFQQKLGEIVCRTGGDFLPLRTDHDPLAALAAYLAHREQRL